MQDSDFQALLCTEWGGADALSLRQLSALKPNADEVVIRVKACSVSFPDALTIQGRYQVKPALPFSPGSDVAGTVMAVGAHVTLFKVGDRVVGPAKAGCAQQVLADPGRLFAMPDALAYAEAAAAGRSYGTSYYALTKRANLSRGETVLILGASGAVGIAALRISKMLGARVVACDATDERLALCTQLGADEVINLQAVDLRVALKEREAQGGTAINVVVDTIGDRYSEPAARNLAWEGRYLIIGFAAGEIPRLPFNIPLLKGISLIGVSWGGLAANDLAMSRQVSREVLEHIAAGRLKPHITGTYALENSPQAFREIIAGRTTGSLVVEM